MVDLDDLHRYGEDLEQYLALRSHPLAVKLIETEAEVPGDAVRPFKDRGVHLAQCQAFSMSRLQGMTIAMLEEDNWCWGPLMAYGLVDPSLAGGYEEIQNDLQVVPRLEYGKYIGIVSAPLSRASFEPDLVIIYSNVAQLNNMLHALMWVGEGLVNSSLFPTASCGFSVVPAFNGQYYITIPDCGELGRAHVGDDEIIFSIPVNKIGTLVTQLKRLDEQQMGYKDHAFLEIAADFPRPRFYKSLFRQYGLYGDDVPTWRDDTNASARFLSRPDDKENALD